MFSDGIAKLRELPVYASLAQWWLKRPRVKEDVDVLGKALDKVPAFGKARAAFENDLFTGACYDSERLCYVVILLENRRPQSSRPEMFRRAQNNLLEIRVLEQPHVCPFLAC